jgi:hypothetical protein
MPLRFHRPLEKMDIWSASSDGFSFVISFESPAGPGFHGRPGYMATWRPLYQNKGAIRISGLAVQNLCRGRGGLRQGN